MIKGSIYRENITFVNIYALNIEFPKYMKQILIGMKGEIDSNTIIGGDFTTPLSTMDRSPDRKSIKRHWT